MQRIASQPVCQELERSRFSLHVFVLFLFYIYDGFLLSLRSSRSKRRHIRHWEIGKTQDTTQSQVDIERERGSSIQNNNNSNYFCKRKTISKENYSNDKPSEATNPQLQQHASILMSFCPLRCLSFLSFSFFLSVSL